ncbi:MAG: RDD family protein [Nocardioides sp.]
MTMPPYPPPPEPAQPYYQQPVAYSHWGKRVGAYLIDALLGGLASIPLWIGYFMWLVAAADTATTDPVTGQTQLTEGPSAGALGLMVIGALTALAFWIWNTCLKGGGTGYTIGKGVLGIKLVKEATGQPIGAGMAFLRQLAHFFDGLCYIGYLWPLWDAKRRQPSRTRSWARSSSTFPSRRRRPLHVRPARRGPALVGRLSGRSPVGRPGGGARCSSAAGLPRRRR